jgi:hypothetical protein
MASSPPALGRRQSRRQEAKATTFVVAFMIYALGNPRKSVAKSFSVCPRQGRHVHDRVRHHQAVRRARRVRDPSRRRPDARRVRHGLRHADDRHVAGRSRHAALRRG